MANINKTIVANNGIDEIHYKTNAGQVILSNKNTVEGEIASIKLSKADTNHNHDSNYLKLTGGTITGALRLKGTTMTSFINCNKKEGREELQIYASGIAYMEGSRGAGIHLYGNNDIKHSGNIALLTGSNDNGTARMIISEKGNVTLGNALWDFVDEGKDVALLNIKGKSGSPALLFHKVAKEDGEIAVPLTENLALGHYDTENNVFTSRFEINGSGNIVSHGEIQMNNKAVRLTTENNSYARVGYEASTGDVYISNANNNWLRIKSDKTITIGGSKVYTALDKPTVKEIGAVASSETTLFNNRNSKHRILNANVNGYPTTGLVIDDLDNTDNSNGLYYLLGNGVSGNTNEHNSLRPKNVNSSNKNCLGQLSAPWDELYLKGKALSSNGYSKLPNGLILQWGIINVEFQNGNISTISTVQLPIVFPNNVVHVGTEASQISPSGVPLAKITTGYSECRTNLFNVQAFSIAGELKHTVAVKWFAIGY